MHDDITSNYPQVYKALYLYVINYCPLISGDYIYIANQNRKTLPMGTEDYAEIFISDTSRRGSNVNEYKKDSENNLSKNASVSKVIRAEIAFFGANSAANREAFALFWADEGAIAFLNSLGLAPHYIDYERNVTTVDGTDQYIEGFAVGVVLGVTYSAEMSVESALELNANEHFLKI